MLSGLDEVLDAGGVASLLDRGFRGMAKRREHWHAPVGDRRTKDRLSDGQRAYNRCQAGLRALVEQSIAHLANAWSLRRWRGRFYRVRDLYRAAGRWSASAGGCTESPPEAASRTPSVSCQTRTLTTSQPGASGRTCCGWGPPLAGKAALTVGPW
jgi:hypothetical protein